MIRLKVADSKEFCNWDKDVGDNHTNAASEKPTYFRRQQSRKQIISRSLPGYTNTVSVMNEG